MLLLFVLEQFSGFVEYFNMVRPRQMQKGGDIVQINILLLLLFSTLTLGIYYLTPSKYKNFLLLVSNFTFYFLCDMRYILIIALEILWSYFIAKKVVEAKSHKRFYLVVAILPVIAALCFFKYVNFFIEKDVGAIRVLMPLGVSYYTFKIISFLVDSYHNKFDGEVSFVNYATYISLFPQITCGPISRPEKILTQLREKRELTESNFLIGINLIISGIFKKVVIADRLSAYVGKIFEEPALYPGLASWLAAFFYTIQIYCDFSGYSEIAIGICKLFGLDIDMNFDKPYFSRSIREFWKRWHISLSSWLRDYIYIPLGGNQGRKWRKQVNILITFLVSGIWHGNGFNFIIWGLYHGILNMIPVKKSEKKIILSCQMIGTFVLVMFGWIIFRAQSVSAGLMFIKGMFCNLRISMTTIIDSVRPFTGDYSCFAYLLIVLLFIFILFVLELKEYLGKIKNKMYFSYVKNFIYILSIILFGAIGENSFIYANF